MKKPHFTIETVTGKPYFKVEDYNHVYFIPDRLRPDLEAYLQQKPIETEPGKPDLINWYLNLPRQDKTALIVAVNLNTA